MKKNFPQKISIKISEKINNEKYQVLNRIFSTYVEEVVCSLPTTNEIKIKILKAVIQNKAIEK